MQVQFNRPVTLGKSTYGKGQHSVPAEEAEGWFFEGLVKAGDVLVLRDDLEAEAEEGKKRGRPAKTAE